MHTDFAVITGARHTAVAGPCQDYCLAEMLAPDRAIAIVADGCSTGGHTDIGARIWARAALGALRAADTIVPADLLEAGVLQRARPALGELPLEDGFSTLAVLQAHGKRLQAAFWGDGALLARHLDGSMTLVNLEFTGNAPPYLNYALDDTARLAWEVKYEKQELLVVTNRYDSEGALLGLKTATVAADAGPWQWHGHLDADELELVVVATDGVASRTPGFIETARQVLAVKAAQGEFMRRRIGRQAHAWQESGTMPADDLAVAAIWLGA